MEILKNLEIVDLGLLYKKDIFIIGDLQLGYEDYLVSKGVFVPKFQFKDIVKRLKDVFDKYKVKTVIINGDLKHEFGKINPQEWDEVLELFDFLEENVGEIVIVKGNHDVVLESILARRNMNLVERWDDEDLSVIHGHKLVDNLRDNIVIAHEHPAIRFKEKPSEKFKCFLVGKYKKKNLVVMPSFNSLNEGSDIGNSSFLSPFLEDVSNFECYIVGDDNKARYFGKIKDLDIA